MVRRGTGRGENPHPQKPRVGHPAQGKPALQSMVRICQTKGYGTARNRPRRKPHPQKPRVGHPAQGKPALQNMVRACTAFAPGALKRRLYKGQTNGLAIVTVVVLFLFLGVDGHAHPGMDAALELGVLSLAQEGAGCVRICRDKDIFWTWRLWHKLAVYQARALRSGNRVAGRGVEGSNKSATEFPDAGKCVCFAAEILEHDAEAVFTRSAIGNKAPGPSGLFGTEFGLKTREGDHSSRKRSSGAHTSDRRESDGIAIVAEMNIQESGLVLTSVWGGKGDTEEGHANNQESIHPCCHFSSKVENEIAVNQWAIRKLLVFVQRSSSSSPGTRTCPRISPAGNFVE